MKQRSPGKSRQTRLRTGLVLSLGFGALLALIALASFGVSQKTAEIDRRVFAINSEYRRADEELSQVRSAIYMAGLLARDALLQPDEQRLDENRRQVVQLQDEAEQHLHKLEQLLDSEEKDKLNHLRRGANEYIGDLAAVAGAADRGPAYELLRRRALLRNRTLALTEEIADLNAANLRERESELQSSRQDFTRSYRAITAIALLLGLGVATVSIRRISRLEAWSEQQRRQSEQAESELRRLSHQLVKAQEEERKVISRELHDEVGQLLTGLRIELANLAGLHSGADAVFRQRLGEAKTLAEHALRAVRDMAMLLRPSMLDDLGLEPALRWQGREFSRRNGIPVHVHIDGDLDTLPEAHRTCLYRVVQEALTNCARHAQAQSITVIVEQQDGSLSVVIEDNGRGLPSGTNRPWGLGLLGIEERVRELNGQLDVTSQPSNGTKIAVRLPLPTKATA